MRPRVTLGPEYPAIELRYLPGYPWRAARRNTDQDTGNPVPLAATLTIAWTRDGLDPWIGVLSDGNTVCTWTATQTQVDALAPGDEFVLLYGTEPMAYGYASEVTL